MEKSFLEQVSTIFQSSLDLKNKYFDGYPMILDHLTMFTYNLEEYQKSKKEADNIGNPEFEDERGTLYKLSNPIKLEDFELIDFKVAKPHIHNHNSHHYAVYYKVENFEDFKKRFDALNDNNVVKQQLHNKLEILEKDAPVILYIVPISEPALEDMDEVKEQVNGETDMLRLQAQLEEERMKRIQVMADFQNYQKRIDQERSTWGAISNMGLIREILEIYDDLHLALNDENLTLDHSKVSLKSAQDKLLLAAATVGIEIINVQVGEEFDKEKMEAVSAIPASEEQKNKVVAVVSSAFKYKDKDFILKPAKVVVGK